MAQLISEERVNQMSIIDAKICKTVGELIEHLKKFPSDANVLINGVTRTWECEGTTNPFVFSEDDTVYIMDKNHPDLNEAAMLEVLEAYGRGELDREAAFAKLEALESELRAADDRLRETS